MKLSNFKLPPLMWVKVFLVIFYTVGVVGFLLPFTKELFIAITPFALLLSVFLLALFHPQFKPIQVFVFVLLYILGFAVEAVGVNTGLIFGNYLYGNGLGLKLFNTPLLIGVNWLFLTYTASSIATKLSSKTIIQILVAPSIMLFYDIVLEHLAPKMDMWSWQNNQIPVNNYTAWWLIGFVFVVMLKYFKVPTSNPLSLLLFGCQYLFFLILYFCF